jgi:EKC/KEOPS complex subunit CGI121/TPRKB
MFLLVLLVLPCRELREQVVRGALVPECGLANAALVPDLFVLQVAAHNALLAQSREALKTRSLHSELVFNLSGSRQVGR